MSAGSRLSPPVRDEIAALRAYELSVPTEGIRAKLDFNESPFDVPPEMKRAVLERLAARAWSRYPEFGAPRLKAAVAKALGVSVEQVVIGNGSGELLLAAISVFAGGGELLLSPPTFSLYTQLAAIAGAKTVVVSRQPPRYDLPEEAFLDAAQRSGTRRVPLVCSPNNPTGGVVPGDFIRRLAERAPVVLADQAYVDFAATADDFLPLLPELPGLVVFRTLSKAFSAAGFRIGYAVAAPELIREIGKAVLPFSVDVAAEELALALLADPAAARPRVEAIVAERERVVGRLKEIGADAAPSASNFLLVSTPLEGRGVAAGLLGRGVLVRDLTASTGGRLRVTIGSREENDVFLSALAEILKERA